MKRCYLSAAKARRLLIGSACLAVFLAAASHTSAYDVSLAWNASTTDASGNPLSAAPSYRLYYGVSSRTYSQALDAGSSTAVSVTGLDPSRKYFFAVTALDSRTGKESAFSEELSVTMPGSDYIAIEGEDAGLTAPMQTALDSAASGGKYICSTTGEIGTAAFTFTAQGGSYVIWALAKPSDTNSAAHNSFYVSVDGAPEDIWDLFYETASPYTEWRWDAVSLRAGGAFNNNLSDPYMVDLSAGTHTLLLRARESDTRIDKIIITSNWRYNPATAAPIMVSQPLDITVTEPDQASFTADAISAQTMAYQWRRNGTPITGATSAAYTLPATSVAADNGAFFDVIVSNPSGAATSSTARLTVNPPPDTTPPSISGPSVLVLEADAGGTCLLPDITKSVTVIDNVSAPAAITVVQAPAAGSALNAGTYSVTLTAVDEAGNIASHVVTVTVNAYVPLATYIVMEAEAAVLASPMQKAADSAASGGTYIFSGTKDKGTASFTFTAKAGSYVFWALAKASDSNGKSHNSFYVSVDGGAEDTWDVFYDAANPYTVWSWDAISLRAGGTQLNNLTDPYTVLLSAGTHTLRLRAREIDTRLDKIIITSDQRYNPTNSAPIIVSQPGDIAVNEPDRAVFTVVASSAQTMTYQWRRNGTPISGATGASFTLSATSAAADNGAGFSVIVSNAAGSTTSTTARLTVNPPSDTTPPSISGPDTLTLSADASGTCLLPSLITAMTFSDNVSAPAAITIVQAPAAGTALSTGTHSVTLTAADEAGNRATHVVTVTVNPYVPPRDTTPPAVAVNEPTASGSYETTNCTLNVSGTASDNTGVVRVNISNNRSDSGTCAGTTNWSYSGLALYSGTNLITVTAYDGEGNSSSKVLTVVCIPRYPGLDGAILRAGMAVQDIQIPDNLASGDRVTCRWQILSYVPLLSAMSIQLPNGTNVTINAVRMGVTDGRWAIGDRSSKVYSFECEWIVPDMPGTARIRFLAAQQDGYAYMNASIPGGVDYRPYGADGKEIERDLVAGIANTPVVSEDVVTAQPWFDSLDSAVLRAGGTIESITIPDHLAAGSTVTCTWDVLSYVPVRSRINIGLPTGGSQMAEATCTGVRDGRWQISTSQSKVYTFVYRWIVPNDPGLCRIRFVNAEDDGYAWMNGNIPGGADPRPAGTDGKEILRDIDSSSENFVEQE